MAFNAPSSKGYFFIFKDNGTELFETRWAKVLHTCQIRFASFPYCYTLSSVLIYIYILEKKYFKGYDDSD